MILQVWKTPELSSKMKEFDTAVTSELERLVTGVLDDSSWELLWVNYHKLRLGKLKEMWEGLRKDLQLNELEPILEQTVLDYVLDQLLKKHTKPSSSSTCGVPSMAALTDVEVNIVRYAAGYVTRTLKQRYEKMDTKEASEIVECLSQMAVEGPGTSFYDYTKEWTKKVNRGRLFEVNESTYLLFRSWFE